MMKEMIEEEEEEVIRDINPGEVEVVAEVDLRRRKKLCTCLKIQLIKMKYFWRTAVCRVTTVLLCKNKWIYPALFVV